MAVGGEIWIDVSGEESTVMLALPLIEPSCALMIAVPPVTARTVPPLTLATDDADEAQLTIYVTTCVLPSLNVPVATQFT